LLTQEEKSFKINGGLMKMDVLKKVPVREQDPKVRATNFEEVCYGYDLGEAKEEASRCIQCKNPKCVTGCPVSIDIPGFIKEIVNDDIEEAFKVISKYSSLPAVCGRVCPQESQCEQRCIRGIKGDPVSIGKLERFTADWARKNKIAPEKPKQLNGKKVAVIGAGPAGLTCAGDLAKLGYDVTIFEALHEPGGVLVYGIPEFRLPKDLVVKAEIENVKSLGVKIETNVVIGKSTTIDELMDEEGFEAVFIGSGAGLPKFMGIPGENANGVFSANEYLTRNNLMKAFDKNYDTPIIAGKKVAVVGGGNVAMDAARTALRLGAEVYIVYRRGESELPARVEEVHHAKEEGIIFKLLTNPKEILVNENGWVSGMRCTMMELGEPDESGRRKPIEKKDSDFVLELDTVIMSLGTSPNPLISSTTKGLETNKHKCIVADEETGLTSREGVFAGGDAVTGAATVILAMGAGKAAAVGIDKYLQSK
jgi:glutamate synthase (NADPH/NADH) small chain